MMDMMHLQCDGRPSRKVVFLAFFSHSYWRIINQLIEVGVPNANHLQALCLHKLNAKTQLSSEPS